MSIQHPLVLTTGRQTGSVADQWRGDSWEGSVLEMWNWQKDNSKLISSDIFVIDMYFVIMKLLLSRNKANEINMK